MKEKLFKFKKERYRRFWREKKSVFCQYLHVSARDDPFDRHFSVTWHYRLRVNLVWLPSVGRSYKFTFSLQERPPPILFCLLNKTRVF